MSRRASSYLVTGATGFIGSNLVHRLSRDGASVFCLASSSRGQIDRIPSLPGVVPIPFPPTGGDLSRLIAEAKPEIVVNLAAGGVDPRSRDVERMVHDNVGILAALINGLSRATPKLILHTGSWSEYAPKTTGTIDEDQPIRPSSLYGAAKAAASIYGKAAAREAEIPFVTLRLFNVYGSGERPERLIPYLITRLSNGDSAELTQGDQIRDLTHVDDVVAAILAAGEADLEPFTDYNVCSGQPIRIRDVAEIVADALGVSESLLKFGAMPMRPDEPSRVVGDNSRFQSATNWRPTISVPEGIRLMLESAGHTGSRA